jgi:hypothetical protein
MESSLARLVNTNKIQKSDYEELLSDIHLFNNRDVQELHAVWLERHGLFKHELYRARRIDAGLDEEDEEEQKKDSGNDEQNSNSSNTRLSTGSNSNSSSGTSSSSSSIGCDYQDSLIYLAPDYHIEHVAVGDGVVVVGNDHPIWVAEVLKLRKRRGSI